MEKKNDLCERLLRFAADVILYLSRTCRIKNTVETIRQLTDETATYQSSNFKRSNSFFSWDFGLGIWGLGLFFTQEFICVT